MMLENFAPFLVEQRKKNNLTQSELAEKLHVSTAAVSKWERGLCLPEVSKLEDIAAVFHLKLIEVMQCEETEEATDEVDAILTDTITLTAKQHRRKTRKWCLFAVVLAALCLCVYFFPFYHVLQVWTPSYYTSGEIEKLLYIGSTDDRDTARLFIAQADAAFSDLTTPNDVLQKKHGLFARYATNAERQGVSEKHSLRLWTAHFDTFDGYGYVWVHYSNTVYDARGETVCGSWDIPSLWIFEKNSDGEWSLMYIKEHP